jgi:hypothetical protein
MPPLLETFLQDWLCDIRRHSVPFRLLEMHVIQDNARPHNMTVPTTTRNSSSSHYASASSSATTTVAATVAAVHNNNNNKNRWGGGSKEYPQYHVKGQESLVSLRLEPPLRVPSSNLILFRSSSADSALSLAKVLQKKAPAGHCSCSVAVLNETWDMDKRKFGSPPKPPSRTLSPAFALFQLGTDKTDASVATTTRTASSYRRSRDCPAPRTEKNGGSSFQPTIGSPNAGTASSSFTISTAAVVVSTTRTMENPPYRSPLLSIKRTIGNNKDCSGRRSLSLRTALGSMAPGSCNNNNNNNSTSGGCGGQRNDNHNTTTSVDPTTTVPSRHGQKSQKFLSAVAA